MRGLRIALVAILCGLIVTLGVGMFLVMSGRLVIWGENSFFNLNGYSVWSNATLRNTEEIEVGNITSVKINGENTGVDIFIRPTDQDKIIMEEYFSKNVSDRQLAEIVQTQNKLEIIPDKSKPQIYFGGYHAYIILQVPERLFSQLQELLVNSTSGDIKIEGFQNFQEKGYVPKAILLSSTSGDMKADYLKAETIQLAANSGDIWVDDMDAVEMQIAATSGDITVQKARGNLWVTSNSGDQRINEIEGTLNMVATSGDITAGTVIGDLAMESSSGTVYSKQLSGKGEFSTTSGDISVNTVGLKDSLTISANSGDVKLTVPSDSKFVLEIVTTSGDIWTKYDDDLSYNKKKNHASGTVGENPDIEIKIKTTSGDVSLR